MKDNKQTRKTTKQKSTKNKKGDHNYRKSAVSSDNKTRTCIVKGTFQSTRRGFAFISTDSQKEPDIFIPAHKTGDAAQGDRVSVKVNNKKSGKRREGEVTSILQSAEEQLAAKEEFPPKVLKELQKFSGEEEILSIAEKEGRPDLRGHTIITIDPEDARDIDDGISLNVRSDGGYILGVHIADVSYYVREGSAIHREALKRGTSIYLVDRVIHMLPPLLSQQLCSLQENKNRLAISVRIELDQWGEIEKYDIFSSLLKVSRQLSYEEAESFICGQTSEDKDETTLAEMLQQMDTLASMLNSKRIKRGALNLNLPESVIKLDEDGKPVSVLPKKPGRAESIIEEFMLLANEIIAEHFDRAGIPFIYRVHPRPTEEKMHVFRKMLALLGIKLPGNLKKVTPRKIQDILSEVKGSSLEKTVNYILLRSLPHAYYSVSNEAHFGLASKHYTHFTSPIRRFPDLQIHAILKDYLKGDLSEEKEIWLDEKLPQRAEHSSQMERAAMEAERESIDRKKIEFMQGKEGETFFGVISGVTSFGLFVELENTIEGLVLLEDLTDDYYQFYEQLMAVIGKKKGKKHSIGDMIKVMVSKVDMTKKTIYFLPVDNEEA